MAVFQHFLPKFLVGGLCNTRSQADNSRQNLKLHSAQLLCWASNLWRKFFAHWEKVDLLRWNSWAWGCWASRGGRSNDQAWLYDPGKFGGLPPPSPRLPTLCARVYSIGKYNAQPKSVWKYTHLANDHHKPYTARISFSSKLASIVFFRPQKLFAFSKDIFFGTILWDSSERHKISNRTDSFILLKVFAAVWRLQKDYKVWNNNWGSQTRWYCLTFKII